TRRTARRARSAGAPGRAVGAWAYVARQSARCVKSNATPRCLASDEKLSTISGNRHDTSLPSRRIIANAPKGVLERDDNDARSRPCDADASLGWCTHTLNTCS